MPINVAKYLMGHSDISLTAKIYTHTTDYTIKEALGKINKRNEERENQKEDEEKIT